MHGAVLWLAGCLAAWLRAWDASVALFDALCSLVGCMDMVLIAIVTAVHCMAGCGFFEGTCLWGCGIAIGVWGSLHGSFVKL